MIATATATEYNRWPSKLLGRAERGETLLIENHGHPAAAIIPQPRPTSGTELARRLAAMRPDPKTASAVAAIIRGMDDAG